MGERQEARQEDHQGWRRQAPEEGQDRVLQDLHLQGAQAGPPRDRDLLQGDVHHELLHQRHLEKIASEAARLARYNKKPTITSGRSRRPCASSSPGSWPSTPCPRGPRRSPSTPPPLKQAGPLSHRSTPHAPLRARKKKNQK